MAIPLNTPWHAALGDEYTAVRDIDGKVVCGMRRPDELQARDDHDAIAELLAMAPELFASLHALLDVMNRSDVELAPALETPCCTDEEWDDARDEAQALLDLLAEAGLTLGEAG